MKNKFVEKLTETERLIREIFPVALDPALGNSLFVLATIEVVGGFEAFNTEPYHNYENWGQGYRVSTKGISVKAEFLEDALRAWRRAFHEAATQGEVGDKEVALFNPQEA